MVRLFNIAVLCALAVAAGASDHHQVELRADPPQKLTAITIRSGDATHSVPVRSGVVSVPRTLPLPWSLALLRFEAGDYTKADLEQRRPWVIRELGALQGRVQGRTVKKGQKFVWILQRHGSEQVTERDVVIGEGGAYEVSLPSGLYHGVLLGAESATRVRSGIVITSGRTTDIGVSTAEPTVTLSVRVVDDRSGRPLAGARLSWDPPGDILNAALIGKLYAQRWSAVTDRQGIATISSVGPIPHSVRWRVESQRHAPARTARVQVSNLGRVTLPDVRMRQEPLVVVRVDYARDEESLDNCSLVIGEIRDEHSTRYTAVGRVRLRAGEARFSLRGYGSKRVWIENRSGRTIFYRDFTLDTETMLLDVHLKPVEVHGKVTQKGKAVAEALVVLAHPRNGDIILAQAPSNKEGEYRLKTWQSGKLTLYTIGPGTGTGRRVGSGQTSVDAENRAEVRADLEIPAAGFSVRIVDAATGNPVRARAEVRARFEDGGGQISTVETDDKGALDISGFKSGTAYVHVEARGYRGMDVTIPISSSALPTTIRLERGEPVAGRVVSANGTPIPGAQVLGGYSSELDDESYYSASTDADGKFSFQNPPAPDTRFYVIAAGYTLGMTLLNSQEPTTIVLQRPSAAIVTLRQNDAPPDKVYLVMAAFSGQLIPLEVLDHIAQTNGMTLYQMCGSSTDGDVVLPGFLGPGVYELYIARRGGKPYIYEPLGRITTPLQRNVVLSLRSSERASRG